VNTLGVLKPEVKAKALRLWLNGLTYRLINEKTGVSLGAMNELVNEARKKAPDIDDLRQLNIALQKSDASVLDAVRGAKLLDKINVLGVSLERLGGFVNIVDKISSEHNVEADKFIGLAIRLTELETKTGKTFHEIVREFEDKQARVKELDLKVKELDGQRVKMQGELSQAREKLSKTLEELKRTTGCQDRLQRLGLEKTATLSEFIEDYELLGFSPKEVQRLAGWRKGLTKLGIDPDGLERFIDEKGPLEVQRSKLKRDVEALGMEVNMLEKRKKALLNENSSLSTVSLILKTGKATLPCKRCNWLIPVALGNKFSYQTMIEKGLGVNVWCPRCGWQNWFDPREVMASIGWIILPT